MKLASLACAVLVMSTLTVGCSKSSEKSTTEVDKTVNIEESQKTERVNEYVKNPDWETLKVGSETSYEPFEFKDEFGLPIGFEIDLIREIGKVQHFNVDIVDHPRKDMLSTLEKEKFSIWVSALSNKPKRAAIMDLSDPIITTEIAAFMLDNDKNKEVNTITDLQGKMFAVSHGASESTLDEIAELAGNKDAAVFSNSFFLAVSSVYQGKADAILADSRVIEYYMKKFPEHTLKKISVGRKSIEISFAVKKGDTETLSKLNEGLSQLKEDGTHQKLVEKWFNGSL